MVRMPLSPRTTASFEGSDNNRRSKNAGRTYSPSYPKPHSGHVRSIRSSWEDSGRGDAENVDDNYKATSSGTGRLSRPVDDPMIKALSSKSNEYLRKWQSFTPSSPKQRLVASPRRRYTPNKDSPTWKSLQKKTSSPTWKRHYESSSGDTAASSTSSHHGAKNDAKKISSGSSQGTFKPSKNLHPLKVPSDIPARAFANSRLASNTDDNSTASNERVKIEHCLSSETDDSGTVNWGRMERLPEEKVVVDKKEEEIRRTTTEEESKVVKTSRNVGSKGGDKAISVTSLLGSFITPATTSTTSASVTSSRSSNKNKSKPSADNITACPSSDSTSSSLIYSLATPSKSSDHSSLSSSHHNVVHRVNTDSKKFADNTLRLVPSHSVEEEEDEGDAEEGTNDPAADLVASTLAECRLLLQLSPPPTPVSRHKRAGSSRSGTSSSSKHHGSSSRSHRSGGSSRKETGKQRKGGSRKERHSHHDEQSSLGMQSSSSTSRYWKPQKEERGEEMKEAPTVPTTSSAAAADSDLAGFLTCPTCSNEFEEGSGGHIGSTHQPLHSFACDHIVCRACVFSAGGRVSPSNDLSSEIENGSKMVACPECGEQNAFDINRPIVSRAYLSLVKRMKMAAKEEKGESGKSRVSELDENSAAAASAVSSIGWVHAKEEKAESDKSGVSESVGMQEGTGRPPAPATSNQVPSQICVPSPKSKGDDHNNIGENISLASSPAVSISASLSHRHNNLPTLTIDVDTPTSALDGFDHPAEENYQDDSNKHQEAETAVTNPVAEPTTPVSRAEYRFLQRKEKLAQSLEKVNRILERSKANKKKLYDQGEVLLEEEENESGSSDGSNGVAGKEEEEGWDDGFGEMGWNVSEGENIDTNAEVKRQTASGSKLRLKKELRIDTGVQAQPRAVKLQQQEPQEEDEASVISPGMDQTDTPAAKKSPTANINQEDDDIDAIPPSRPGGGDNSITDIFRIDKFQQEEGSSAQFVEFGTDFGAHMIAESISNDSTLTDNGGTLFLLAENRSRQPTPATESRIKDYQRASDRQQQSSSRGGGSIGHQQQQCCPQFLPSLNYATMHESNEFVGLVVPNGGGEPFPTGQAWEGGGAKSVVSLLSTTSRQMKRSRKFGARSGKKGGNRGGGRLFKHLFTQSFDEEAAYRPNAMNSSNSSPVGLVGNLYWGGQEGLKQPSFDLQQEDNNQPKQQQPQFQEQQGPTYDFSMHSCSMSPTSLDGGLLDGGLVTHKPRRLHTTILRRFRGKKKERKSLT